MNLNLFRKFPLQTLAYSKVVHVVGNTPRTGKKLLRDQKFIKIWPSHGTTESRVSMQRPLSGKSHPGEHPRPNDDEIVERAIPKK